MSVCVGAGAVFERFVTMSHIIIVDFLFFFLNKAHSLFSVSDMEESGCASMVEDSEAVEQKTAKRCNRIKFKDVGDQNTRTHARTHTHTTQPRVKSNKAPH